MSVGGYLSTFGHGSLLAFVFLGPGFDADPLPMEDVQEVSVISEAEFAALFPPTAAPEVPVEPVALTPPEEPEPEPSPAPPPPEPAPAPPAEPAPPPPAPAPPTPVPAPPEPEPEPEVSEEVIIPPLPDAPEAIAAPVSNTRPNPRPAPRVAPEPIAAPEADTQVAEEVQEAAVPVEDPEAEVVAEEEQEATSPEEATTETVTEAEEEEPSGAVASSLRPQARPARPTQTAETDEAPATETEAEEEDPLAAALTEALETDEAPARPTGPPLTSGETNALRVAVAQCWNVGSLSTDALQTVVVVGVDMNVDGTPNNGSVRMISSSGGSAQAAQQAFEAARRAIIRCGARGFDLPREKYEQWRQIEMTFNPEQMRIR